MSRRQKWILGTLIAYVATVLFVGAALWRARSWATAELSDADSVAKWQQWKADVVKENQRGGAPVERKEPKSDEPPALVLLRDGFAGVVGGVLVIGSFLFFAAAFFVYGVFSGPTQVVAAGDTVELE